MGGGTWLSDLPTPEPPTTRDEAMSKGGDGLATDITARLQRFEETRLVRAVDGCLGVWL